MVEQGVEQGAMLGVEQGVEQGAEQGVGQCRGYAGVEQRVEQGPPLCLEQTDPSKIGRVEGQQVMPAGGQMIRGGRWEREWELLRSAMKRFASTLLSDDKLSTTTVTPTAAAPCQLSTHGSPDSHCVALRQVRPPVLSYNSTRRETV